MNLFFYFLILLDSEHSLLSDLTFVFLGIDGKYIKFNEKKDSFEINPPCVNIGQGVLCSKIAEMGWVYVRIELLLLLTSFDINDNLKKIN